MKYFIERSYYVNDLGRPEEHIKISFSISHIDNNLINILDTPIGQDLPLYCKIGSTYASLIESSLEINLSCKRLKLHFVNKNYNLQKLLMRVENVFHEYLIQ